MRKSLSYLLLLGCLASFFSGMYIKQQSEHIAATSKKYYTKDRIVPPEIPASGISIEPSKNGFNAVYVYDMGKKFLLQYIEDSKNKPEEESVLVYQKDLTGDGVNEVIVRSGPHCYGGRFIIHKRPWNRYHQSYRIQTKFTPPEDEKYEQFFSDRRNIVTLRRWKNLMIGNFWDKQSSDAFKARYNPGSLLHDFPVDNFDIEMKVLDSFSTSIAYSYDQLLHALATDDEKIAVDRVKGIEKAMGKTMTLELMKALPASNSKRTDTTFGCYLEGGTSWWVISLDHPNSTFDTGSTGNINPVGAEFVKKVYNAIK
jgi:hypothetical protein